MSARGFFRRNWFSVAGAMYAFTTAAMGVYIWDLVWWTGLTFACVAYVGASVDTGS
jgi:hypothetical protein